MSAGLLQAQGVLFHEGQSFGVVPPVRAALCTPASTPPHSPLPACCAHRCAAGASCQARLLQLGPPTLTLARPPLLRRCSDPSFVPPPSVSSLSWHRQGTKINSKGQEVPETVRLYSIASSRYGDRHDGKTCTLCVVRVIWRGEPAAAACGEGGVQQGSLAGRATPARRAAGARCCLPAAARGGAALKRPRLAAPPSACR